MIIDLGLVCAFVDCGWLPAAGWGALAATVYKLSAFGVHA